MLSIPVESVAEGNQDSGLDRKGKKREGKEKRREAN